jgi:hypothetical protein
MDFLVIPSVCRAPVKLTSPSRPTARRGNPASVHHRRDPALSRRTHHPRASRSDIAEPDAHGLLTVRNVTRRDGRVQDETTLRHRQPQVTRHLPFRPHPTKHRGDGFESHLTAAMGQRPLPTRQASPRTGLTLPPRWCHRCQARAMFTLTGRAPDVP